jgi:hypothetical protein
MRSFITYTLSIYDKIYEVKEDEMGRACNMHEGEDECV